MAASERWKKAEIATPKPGGHARFEVTFDSAALATALAAQKAPDGSPLLRLTGVALRAGQIDRAAKAADAVAGPVRGQAQLLVLRARLAAAQQVVGEDAAKQVDGKGLAHLLGREALIGLSIKTVDEARTAPLDFVDYVGVGGVYATTSKDNPDLPIGIAGLRDIVAAFRARRRELPICAIAGIDATNAGPVIAAGADGVAVISALSMRPDPQAAARELRAVVDAALRGPR